MTSLLDYSTWPVLSLPPLSQDTEPLYPTLTSLYADVFSHPLFFQLFAIGLIFWYSLDVLGCHMFYKCVPLGTQQRMQKEQFAGHFISFFNALMIASSSLFVVLSYTPFAALSADPNETPLVIFKCSAIFSAAYFLLDAIFITMYYKQATTKTVAFVIHHFLSGICIISCTVTGPINTYVSALNFMIEWSTVLLNIRIFARIWNLERIYFVSGIGVIVSYPLTRIVWNGYLILIAFTSEYVEAYSTYGGGIVLGTAGLFVAALSSFYYFTVILRKPQKIYILGQAEKRVQKDC